MSLQLIIPALWTLIMLIAYLIVKTNKKFPVTKFDSYYRVDASPALTWTKTKKGSKIAGFIFLFVMWVAFILLSMDIITINPHSASGNFIVLVPAALSIIFFFSSYSSKLTNNYITVADLEFNRWITDGFIEKKGDNHYVDTNGDKLLHLFDNKQWIN